MNATRTVAATQMSRFKRFTSQLEALLTAAGVAAEPCHLPAEIEAVADEWMRSAIYGTTDVLPDLPRDVLVRRSLLARCRFAKANADSLGMEEEQSEQGLLEIFLIRLWHEQFHALWLNG